MQDRMANFTLHARFAELEFRADAWFNKVSSTPLAWLFWAWAGSEETFAKQVQRNSKQTISGLFMADLAPHLNISLQVNSTMQ
jgi:hypothetical protein